MRINFLDRNFSLSSFLLLSVGILLLIWPIPHTVCLREILLFSSLFITYSLIRKNGLCLKELIIPAIIYILFLGWAFSVSVFSVETLWAIKEFKTQWVIGTLPLILGIGIAILANKRILKLENLCLLLFWSLTFHVVCIGIDGMSMFLKRAVAGRSFSGLTGITTKVGGLTPGPIDASVLSSLLMVIIFVELFFRTVHKKEYLCVNKNILYFSLIVALLSSLACGMRNVIEILTIFVLLNAIILFSHKISLKKKTFFVVCSLLLCIFVFLFIYNTDRRWEMLPETINTVWNTKEDEVLLKTLIHLTPPPILSNNKPANISNYNRFARFKLGLDFIRESPYGIGFGRNAFGYSLKHKYGIENMTGLNSESSVMGLLIGTGLVGLFLWLSTFLSLLWLALRYFIKHENYYSLWLIMTIVCFGSRTIIDSVLRDHLLHQFIFLVGFLSVIMIYDQIAPNP